MLPLQTEVKYRPRAKNVSRVPTDLFVSFPMFQFFFEKMHSRTPTNEQEHCDFFLKICTRKRRQIRPDGMQMSKKIVVWRCLGAVWGGLGAQRARKPTRMHFRMRKPRSWLTLGGCFLVQFVVCFVFFFVVFSSLRPERYFIDFYAILSLFSTPFLEFFGARWKSCFLQPSKQNHDFQGSRASIFQCFFSNLFRIPFRTSFSWFFWRF